MRASARTLIRNGAVKSTRRLADRLGYDMVYRNYYSPIPQSAELSPETWLRPSSMRGVPLSSTDQLRHLDQLAPYLAEFRSLLDGGGGGNGSGFYLGNGSFGPVDADVLHATIRFFMPRRVIELGSGASTFVSARACFANGRDGNPTELVSIDPFPPSFIPRDLEGLSELRTAPATSVPVRDFEDLRANDLLFIDTTHTVKVGSEVNHLVLEVLPRLGPGVIVHFHDIFLPWEYPREWIERRGYYWAEQYLLHAFLSQNSSWEVLFASHFLWRESRPELERRIDPSGIEKPPSSLWLRHVASG
jgi:hypothetical protein